jgi:hypothetical protein
MACDGKTLAKVDWPFPTPPADKDDWSVFTRITTDEWLFF